MSTMQDQRMLSEVDPCSAFHYLEMGLPTKKPQLLACTAEAAWMQNIEKDQGAFDETVLEVLGMEVRLNDFSFRDR